MMDSDSSPEETVKLRMSPAFYKQLETAGGGKWGVYGEIMRRLIASFEPSKVPPAAETKSSVEDETRQVNFRLPARLHEQLKAVCDASPGHLSMSSEIARRLTESFDDRPAPIRHGQQFPAANVLITRAALNEEDQRVHDELSELIRGHLEEWLKVPRPRMVFRSDHAINRPTGYSGFGSMVTYDSYVNSRIIDVLTVALDEAGWILRATYLPREGQTSTKDHYYVDEGCRTGLQLSLKLNARSA